ncbi:hypothetical protein N7456_006109 [Penicillium angulare]|uniref:NAD-dependent epimerase/dehydratase domain-containing protein n=1 Tax=Penicillium angulare TaxID=116970 RepID=A0A9W9FZP3_9EURO|nr:hypothetical protein N7456_006109 [Penicillium angulare]
MEVETTYNLPQGSRILVTGANGFIASHIVDNLLRMGYLVRGTTRTQKPWLNELFEQKYGIGVFETVRISNFDNLKDIERLLNGVDGIVHAASDMSFIDDPQSVIPWVVQAMKNLLEAATKTATVKRVVLVSSSSAAYDLHPNPAGREIDTHSWNEGAIQAAWDENTPQEKKNVAIYSTSKIEGEKEAWKWAEDPKCPFEFNSVLPSFTVGRILHPEIFGSTMGHLRQLLDGNPHAFTFPEQWYVDVEDVAKLCIIGLLDSDVKSQRIFAFGEQMNWTDTISLLRELRPENNKIPDPPADDVRDSTEVFPRTRSQILLRGFFDQLDFTPIKDSIEKGIEDLP